MISPFGPAFFAALALALAAQTPEPPVRRDAGSLTFLTWPGLEGVVDRLVQGIDLARPLPALPPDVLAGAGQIRVYLAPDEARFRDLTGGRAPDWGAGVANPDDGIIVLPVYASSRGNVQDLPRVLRHELAHVALHRYVHPAAVPRWFSEGYATWAADQLDTEAGWILRLAFLTDRAPRLDSLVLDWPDQSTDARVAYLLTASAVDWLHDRGGERALRLFLDRWKRDGNFERALRATYGLTVGQLERYWGQSVRRRYGWLLFFAQSTVAWAILAVIAVALVILRRRRDRGRLERLRETEPPDTPAYWAGEVPADPSGPPTEGDGAGDARA